MKGANDWDDALIVASKGGYFDIVKSYSA